MEGDRVLARMVGFWGRREGRVSGRPGAPALLGVLGVCGLAACGGLPAEPANYVPNPVFLSRVEQVPRSLLIRGTEAFDAADTARLQAFAVAYRERGRGPLALTVTDRSQAQARAVAERILSMVARQGVPAAAVEVAASAGPSPGVVLAFTDFVLEPPDCPQENAGKDLRDNGVSALFGCALERSVMAMIANPADLISPHDRELAHTGRMIEVTNNYRLGKPTEARRPSGTGGTLAEVGK